MADEKKIEATPLDEPLESAGLKSFTYDDKIKSIIADWLAFELSARQDDTTRTIADEKFDEFKQRRLIGKGVAWVSGVASLLILGVLMFQIMIPSSAFYCKLGDIPQAIFISASFLSFTVISGVFIKGLFYKSKDESDDSPIKEATDILKQLYNNNK